MMVTAERLREVLRYDPATGAFTWMIRPAPRSRVRAGDLAGCLNADGYRVICIAGHPYYAHRLAWLWMTGGWPLAEIDHKNTDPSDNRWDNLRAATRSQNLANARAQKNNKSGLKGVSWHNPTRKWRAGIMIDRKLIHLGYFDTPQAAHLAYAIAADKHFGAFARAA